MWLEYKGKSLIGGGRCNLLKSIDKTNSIKLSAKKMGISEKTAHNHIKRIEERLNKKIITSSKGGKNAGGKTILTNEGKNIIKIFENATR